MFVSTCVLYTVTPYSTSFNLPVGTHKFAFVPVSCVYFVNISFLEVLLKKESTLISYILKTCQWKGKWRLKRFNVFKLNENFMSCSSGSLNKNAGNQVQNRPYNLAEVPTFWAHTCSLPVIKDGILSFSKSKRDSREKLALFNLLLNLRNNKDSHFNFMNCRLVHYFLQEWHILK